MANISSEPQDIIQVIDSEWESENIAYEVYMALKPIYKKYGVLSEDIIQIAVFELEQECDEHDPD